MNFFLLSIIKAAVLAAVLLTTLAYLQWVERKVIAHIQVRLGPSRVGPHGLMQPLADVIKLITKEDLVPPHVNKFLYLFAPFFAIVMALLSVSIIPFGSDGHHFRPDDLDADDRPEYRRSVYPCHLFDERVRHRAGRMGLEQQVLAAGRAAQFGADDQLRTAAEHGHRRSAAGCNTLSLQKLVESQGGFYFGVVPQWNIVVAFPRIVFIIFLIAGFAETNRIPFDLPEAENELVAGFHTEYSSMKFACLLHGRIRQHDHDYGDDHGAVPGRMAAVVSGRFGSNFVPTLIFGVAARCLLSRAEPGAPHGSLYAARLRLAFSSDWRCCF